MALAGNDLAATVIGAICLFLIVILIILVVIWIKQKASCSEGWQRFLEWKDSRFKESPKLEEIPPATVDEKKGNTSITNNNTSFDNVGYTRTAPLAELDAWRNQTPEKRLENDRIIEAQPYSQLPIQQPIVNSNFNSQSYTTVNTTNNANKLSNFNTRNNNINTNNNNNAPVNSRIFNVNDAYRQGGGGVVNPISVKLEDEDDVRSPSYRYAQHNMERLNRHMVGEGDDGGPISEEDRRTASYRYAEQQLSMAKSQHQSETEL